MFLKVYKFKFLMALLLVPFLVTADPPGWEKTETLFTHVLSVPSTVVPTVNALPIEDGDFIGVFFNNGGVMVCGGSVEYTAGFNLALSTFGDDPTTPAKDGFADGEEFIWRIYDGTDNFWSGATYALPGEEFFAIFGFSDVTSLAGPTFAVSASADPTTLCAAGDVTLTGAELEGDVVTWEWFIGATSIGTGQVLTYGPVSATTTFTLVATDATPKSTTATVTVVGPPAVFAGADGALCASGAAGYSLADATAANYLFLQWSTSGDGVFSDAGILNPVYTPGAADLLAGNATLTLTSITVACGNVTDAMVLTIQEDPSINIIPLMDYVCYGDSYFFEFVEAADYDALQWFTTNGGGFFDNENILQPTYFPSPTVDYPQQCIIIAVTASSIDPCTVSAEDFMDLCFVAPPTAFAGDPMSYCSDVAVSHTFADAVVTVDVNYGGDILWETTGDGAFDDATIANPIYTFGANDLALGGVIDFTLTVTGVACAPAVSTNQLSVTLSATAYAGVDATICEFECYTLADALASNYEAIQWYTTNGGGFFNDETLMNPEYCPSPTVDYPQSCVELWIAASPLDPCAVTAEDMMLLCFQMLPVIEPGDDATICSNEKYTTNATVENSVGPYQWTHDGFGYLNNATTLNATYVANVLDGGNVVTLTLSAASLAPCVEIISASLELTILHAPYVNAGADATICETETYTMEGEAEFICPDPCLQTVWVSLGDGTFDFPCSKLDPIYTPGAGDLAAGCVTLVLIGYPCEPCQLWELDKMKLCFDPAPSVWAGDDKTICELTSVQLDCTAENTCGLQWVTYDGTGTFSDETILHPIYTPSAQDVISGTIHLTLIGAPCLNCSPDFPAMDEMALTIQHLPLANAGVDGTICEDGTFTLSSASVTYNNGQMWQTSGDGAFNDVFAVNAIYTPGVQDRLDGSVELCLNAYPTAPCATDFQDCMTLTLQGLPSVDIIPVSSTICYDLCFTFNASNVVYGNYSALQWFTTNGGGFFDNETTEYPIYCPSPSIDYPQGCVTLGVAVSPLNPCTLTTEDFMELCFQAPVEVFAGADATICEDATYTANPTVANGGTLLWSTSGTGAFDDATLAGATYTPSADDIFAGSVVLTLTVQPLSNCEVASSTLTLYFTLLPLADAGSDATICEMLCQPPFTYGYYTLAGEVTNACGSLWTGGTGTFANANLATGAVYTLSAGDVAAGSVVLTLHAIACNPCTVEDTDQMTITVQYFPQANAGPDQTICEGETVQLNGTTTYSSGVFWDYALLGEGDGTFDSQIIEDPIYTPGAGDIELGYVQLFMVAFPTSPCCYPDVDAMTIYITRRPVADAGADATICAGETVQLNGSEEFADSWEWTTAGDGAFSPDEFALDAVYTPGVADVLAGTVQLCLYAFDGTACAQDYFDCMTLTILAPPTVNAGLDASTCEVTGIQLAATATNYSSLLWTAPSGLFSDATIEDPIYTPAVGVTGNVTLTITVIALDPCTLVVSDDVVIFVQPELANVSAGPDASTCEETTIQLDGTADNYSAVLWTGGLGLFSDATILDPTYTPAVGETGNVTLTLTATAIDPCTFVDADDVVIFVQPDLANVDAGDDGATCEATPYQLTGTADNASIIFWSTTGDGAFDDASILNPIYTPGADDIDNGSVELCINALPILPCYGTGPVVDCMTLSIQGAPTADAGFDQTICEDQTALLNGTATNYASLLWTAPTGTFSDPTIEDPIYTPAVGVVGNVTLTLTVEAIGPCTIPAADEVVITVIGLPEVNAGADATICETETFTTAPTVVNAIQVFWSGGIDGYFTPENSAISVYTPGSADFAAGSVELCLTVVGDLPCESEVEDCLVLSFDDAPTAYAGVEATICEGDTYQLDGDATNESAVLWTGGEGTFNPGRNVEDPIYTPSAAEIAAKQVVLCLEVTGAGACELLEPAVDCMTLSIVPNPVITLAAERELDCDDFDRTTLKWKPILLDATVDNEASLLWSTDGDGHFDDATVEDATYHLGLNDIWGGGVTLTLTASGPDACNYVAEATIELLVPTQIIQVESVNAWRGISSYVDKSASTVPAVMAPVVNELIIMINKAGKYYWPEPTPPINQLGNWLPIGYKAKFESPCCLPIYGTPVTDQTFLVNGNFTYLPVLTNVSTSIADLIGADTTKIQLIFDWVSQDVWYRPAVFSGTFTTLEPGNAYLLVAKSPYTPFTVTYPAFDLNQPVVTKASGPVDFGPNTTPWNDVVRTSQAHFIMFADVASGQLHAGDVLAAFDQNGNCVGMETYVGAESLYKLVANGDDLLTSEIDGYEEGEAMSFRLYRPSTEEIFDVAFTYDPNYPNYDGNFATYGVSNVVGMTMSITSINEVTDNNVQVYPNPAKDVINVVSDLNVKNITLVNYVGQMVYNQNVNGNSFQVNVSGLGTGMYVVRIETIDGSIITKRITVK